MPSKDPDERRLIAQIASETRWRTGGDPQARLRLSVIQARQMAEKAAEQARTVERELTALNGDGATG